MYCRWAAWWRAVKTEGRSAHDCLILSSASVHQKNCNRWAGLFFHSSGTKLHTHLCCCHACYISTPYICFRFLVFVFTDAHVLPLITRRSSPPSHVCVFPIVSSEFCGHVNGLLGYTKWGETSWLAEETLASACGPSRTELASCWRSQLTLTSTVRHACGPIPTALRLDASSISPAIDRSASLHDPVRTSWRYSTWPGSTCFVLLEWRHSCLASCFLGTSSLMRCSYRSANLEISDVLDVIIAVKQFAVRLQHTGTNRPDSWLRCTTAVCYRCQQKADLRASVAVTMSFHIHCFVCRISLLAKRHSVSFTDSAVRVTKL